MAEGANAAHIDDLFAEEGKFSKEESRNLLNQCIALGMENMKECGDRSLENIDQPPFFAEANLDGDLPNVEEGEKWTAKQRRQQSKERNNTGTGKLSSSKPASAQPSEGVKKSTPGKDRRTAEKDRFRTRTLSRGDFDEVSKSQRECVSPKPLTKNAANEESGASTDGEKNAKRAKTGITIVKSRPSAAKSAGSINAIPFANELPVIGLQRQNTFTKDESSAIPVRKNSFKSQNTTTKLSTPGGGGGGDTSTTLRSGIPFRVKEPSPKIGRLLNGVVEKSPDLAKNRFTSTSENNNNNSSNSNTTTKTTNGVCGANQNGASPPANNGNCRSASTKPNPSGLPVRRESSLRSANRMAFVK